MNNTIADYTDFVASKLSEPTTDFQVFIQRLQELHNNPRGVNIPALDAGAKGLASEGGELGEIVKKIIFQGKPLDENSIFHMKRELGDVIFYWITACIALGFDPMEVIAENVNKLDGRYPDGFAVDKSENRNPDDL